MYKELKENEEILCLIERGDKNLEVLGYTEHSIKHCMKVAKEAERILKALDFDKRQAELAKIAGLLHDIGNAINRNRHAEYGAILANQILEKTELDIGDRLAIVSAIGNHDETTGGAKDPVSAALIALCGISMLCNTQ